MADSEFKVPGQPQGAYYVDDNCIDCDLCRSTANLFFDRSDELYVSYVVKQPQSAQEIALCEKALRECPVDSIGNDGFEV
jgi:ferredoxin